VLTYSDAGPGYVLNHRVSGPRTLGVVTAGDTGAVKALLRADWLRGAEAAFSGQGTRPGIVSIGDVFRQGTQVDAILAAWQADARRALSGSGLPLPANAPGTRPALIRGTFAGYAVLLYMWRAGDTIGSVELIGGPTALRTDFLLELAARQQARVRAATVN
jgi:hypothetical protein